MTGVERTETFEKLLPHAAGTAIQRPQGRSRPGWSRASQPGTTPMTKLSDTQAITLTAAAQRPDGNLLPLPGSLRGGAAGKVVGALLARGLAAEHIVDSPSKADPAMTATWRNEDDGRAVLLIITAAGVEAIGVEPATLPCASDTNSAGDPALGAPTGADTAPEEPARKGGAWHAGAQGAHGRGQRACADAPRRHQGGAADRNAPPQGGRDHPPTRDISQDWRMPPPVVRAGRAGSSPSRRASARPAG
jgi:hypothetical protein